jgi:hypothetical protein
LFPSNDKLWAKYAELRGNSLRNDGDEKIATEFYREYQDEMDSGSRVAWAKRFNKE